MLKIAFTKVNIPCFEFQRNHITIYAPNKFRSIINLVSANVYDYIEECASFEDVVNVLDGSYIKTPNEIFARHQLLTRHQNLGESLDEFLQDLRKLSKNCNHKTVSAEKYREEQVRCFLITVIASNYIRLSPRKSYFGFGICLGSGPFFGHCPEELCK